MANEEFAKNVLTAVAFDLGLLAGGYEAKLAFHSIHKGQEDTFEHFHAKAVAAYEIFNLIRENLK